VSRGFIASAVAAGVLLAALHGHLPAAAHAAATASGAAMPVSGNVALGRQLASAYGWGSGAEWTCLDEL
jgi:hypothetical protein